MSDTFGRTSQLPFAFYDHASACLRTCEATLLSDSTEFLVTLPASGSMRSGRLFQRPRLVLATSGSAFSSLLPTPRAQDGPHGGPGQTNGRGEPDSLPAIGQLLPTPTRRDHKGRNQRDDDTCLPGALLPTPQAKNNENQPSDNYGMNLGEALLPTPVADNSRGLPSPTTDYQSLANSCQPQHRSPTRTRNNPQSGSSGEPTLFSEQEPTTDSRSQ